MASERVCLLDCVQGQFMGDAEIDSLVKTFDKDGNSLFDKVCGASMILCCASWNHGF